MPGAADPEPGPGAAVWRVRAGATPRVLLDRAVQPAVDPAIEAEWRRLTALNPAMYDAPILSVHEWDEPACTVRCRVMRYKHLAARPRVPNRAELLSILGLTLCVDASGVEHVLLGRRGPRTRIYGGMWELAPAGGIDLPPEGLDELPASLLLRQLAEEFDEELGPMLDPGVARQGREAALRAPIVALVRDPGAFSLDMAAVVRLEAPLERARPTRSPASVSAWEYTELAWVPRPGAAEFLSREPVIPTTRALLTALPPIEA